MTEITKEAIQKWVANYLPKAYLFNCEYKIAEASSRIHTIRLVHAKSPNEATKKLRANFKKNHLILVRYDSMTIQ